VVRIATRNRPAPDWEYIYKELRKKGVTLQLLWREYREQHPDGFGYSQFCHYFGHNAAIFYSILESAKQNGLNPFDYLSDILTKIPNTQSKELFRLLPYHYFK